MDVTIGEIDRWTGRKGFELALGVSMPVFQHNLAIVAVPSFAFVQQVVAVPWRDEMLLSD